MLYSVQKKHFSIFITVLLILMNIFLIASAAFSEDTCLALVATRMETDWSSSYVYQQFSDKEITIKQGDTLEYDLFISPDCPNSKGGINILFENRKDLQSVEALKDQEDLGTHWGVPLIPAVNAWYHRSINLDPVAGWKTGIWTLVISGDGPGAYIKFYDNIVISHADGAKTVIYENGTPSVNSTYRRRAFYKLVILQPIARDKVADIKTFQETLKQKQIEVYDLKELDNHLNWAKRIIALSGRNTPEILAPLQKTQDSLKSAMNDPNISPKDLLQIRKDAGNILKNTLLPFSREFTGHLVSHAHIDAQWLWEWPETLEEFKNTFRQALIFMDEYPGFTFTQSSSMFYQATEYRWPELFKKIQERVKSGQWELVGGRITEADNNLISPESHVREFLYGQRYFRERFEGRQAVVAWEPDTFGHNAQMPQIVKLGGCRYYYFCRTGKNHPLFWWEGLDGTRLLAFQEVNSWYNSDLSHAQFEEILDFYNFTASKDMLWVYGVGNHGGGASREDLNIAENWMSAPYLPQVKFSTATEFFETVEKKYDLKNIPTVKGELNFIFEGCYTTHGDIKRLNNDAQAITESAEAIAAIAARYGFPYPGVQIRQNWEDICWNHHHDTIDGSAVHAPYERSRQVYGRAIGQSRLIAQDALSHLATMIKAPKGAIVAFNPGGTLRDAAVTCVIPSDMNIENVAAKAGDNSTPIQIVDPVTRRGIFIARDIPPCGYKVYEIVPGEKAFKPGVQISPDGVILENARLKMKIDPGSGAIKSLYHKDLAREFIPDNGSGSRLEIHWEKLGGMSAWVIGSIDHVEDLGKPVSFKILEKGPQRVMVEISYRFRENLITQRLSLSSGSDCVEGELAIDWKETAHINPKLSPFLKLAIDVNIKNPAANYDIPFGNVSRPIDGHEVPALKWVDVSNGDFGFSLINDSKHGHSITTDTVRLSLVRTPDDPDPTSDNYLQTVRYLLYPHAGDWKSAETVSRALAFVHPVLTTLKAVKNQDLLPSEFSFVNFDNPHVMITAVKRAEDDDDLVVRFYESEGRLTATALNTAWRPQKCRIVDFLEDKTGDELSVKSGGIPMELKAYEIKSVKLNLDLAPGVEMTGTRGSGDIRPF
jgi:alpha-mannosidase